MLLFVVFISAGFAIVFAPPVQPWMRAFTRQEAAFSAAIIRAGHGHVLVNGDVMQSPGGFAMQIITGCNGINVVVLLWAAVLAWPAGIVGKLKAMLVGGVVILAANTIRIISLFYLGQWNTTWFEWMHEYVWELLIMILGLGVFALWIRRTPASAASGRAT
jgi:exosortase H (IPTLxxWG-CTERM-specific)